MKGGSEYNANLSVVSKSTTKGGRHNSTILTGKKNKTDLVRALASNQARDKWYVKFKNCWRSRDVFGERVEFTFKGKRSY